MSEGSKIVDNQAVLDTIMDGGVIAVMRGAFTADVAVSVCEALFDEGITAFELTMNSQQPIAGMQAVRQALGDDAVVGMGTVMDVDSAQQVLAAGADFVVSPAFQPDVVEYVLKQDGLMIPGVITPSEAVAAWAMGLRLLKLFPIGLLGVAYFKTLFGPLNHMRFTCNGTINADNAREFIQAGAVGVGVGSWLTGDGTWTESRLRSRARILLNAVAVGRGEPETREA